MAQKKTRLLAYGQAANYYLFYTLVSFICLCGGPGLHFLLTLFGDNTPDPSSGVQPLSPMLLPPIPPPNAPPRSDTLCTLHSHCTQCLCIASFAVFTLPMQICSSANASQLVWTALDYFRLPYGEIVTIAIVGAGPRLAKILAGWVLVIAFVIGFFMFYIWSDDIAVATSQQQCTTAYNCMLWGLENGIKGNIPLSWVVKFDADGINDIPKDFHTDNGNQLQWLFNMIMFVVYRYSFSGILTATIVGVFRLLNERIAAKAADGVDKCLICSIHRFKCDDYGGMYKHSFVHHNP